VNRNEVSRHFSAKYSHLVQNSFDVLKDQPLLVIVSSWSVAFNSPERRPGIAFGGFSDPAIDTLQLGEFICQRQCQTTTALHSLVSAGNRS
jgi:hypothetical protein